MVLSTAKRKGSRQSNQKMNEKCYKFYAHVIEQICSGRLPHSGLKILKNTNFRKNYKRGKTNKAGRPVNKGKYCFLFY